MAEAASIKETSFVPSERARNERIARMGSGEGLRRGWGGNPYAQREWGDKISSFRDELDYDRTDDTNYMSELTNRALRHFGFKGDARFTARTTPGFTDYSLILGVDKVVSAYRQYGSEDRKIGANLEGMINDALVYKISRKSGAPIADSLTDAMGNIQGLRWKFKR